MTNLFLKQTFLLSSSKFKESVRKHGLKMILGFIIIAFVSLEYGLLMAFIFTGYSNFNNLIKPSNPSFITIDFYKYLPRDLLLNGFIVIYLSFLLPDLIKAAVGIGNPFINNESDVNLQLLLPVNPYVSYFSTFMSITVRNIFISLIIPVFIFGPLIYVLKVSMLRLVLLVANVFIGLEMMLLVSNVTFFLFNQIRAGRDWDILVADKSKFFLNGSTLIFPILFLQLVNGHYLWTYQMYSNYYFIPFVNVSVSSVGLLFRSGVPLVAYLSLLSSLLEILLLFIVVLVFIHLNQTTTEFGDLLPIMDFLNSRQQKIFIRNNENPITSDISKVEASTTFSYSNSFRSLIAKDWLLFSRNSEFKGNFLASIFCSIVITILLFLNAQSSPNIFFIVVVLTGYEIAFIIDTMTKIFYSISLNHDLLHVEDSINLKIKLAFAIVASVPILLILAYKISFLVVILILALFILTELLNRWHLSNFFVEMIVGLILGTIFINLFILI